MVTRLRLHDRVIVPGWCVDRLKMPPSADTADRWQRAIDITGASIVVISVLVMAYRAMQG
ncbi:hypothetical protein ACLIYM_20595 [Streptomyces fenghuangensis]